MAKPERKEKNYRETAGFHENRSWGSRPAGSTNAIKLLFAAEALAQTFPDRFHLELGTETRSQINDGRPRGAPPCRPLRLFTSVRNVHNLSLTSLGYRRSSSSSEGIQRQSRTHCTHTHRSMGTFLALPFSYLFSFLFALLCGNQRFSPRCRGRERSTVERPKDRGQFTSYIISFSVIVQTQIKGEDQNKKRKLARWKRTSRLVSFSPCW